MRSSVRYAPVLAAAFVVLTAGCSQDESPMGPESPPALEATATTALTFSGMDIGWDYSCGVSSDSRGYCWGRNSEGQLGDGSATQRLTPVEIAGGLRFRQLSADFDVTCGVTTSYLAYCWGLNDRGELGDGTTTRRLTPVAVVGGHKFIQVRTNFEHTCGLSYPDNKAWCWGKNYEGQLGNGTRDLGSHSVPTAVLGGLTFRRITTGYNHTCGVTTSNKVYCWGLNKDGQLGDGTDVYRRLTPRLVAGGLAFNWVDAGAYYTCAVTTANKACCWGNGKNGQRGDGGVTERVRAPRAVFGNHLFTKVSGGDLHTCGITTTNQAWCWGWNADGQLGDGSLTDRLTPHLVAGGFAFNQVSAGSTHTCARTTAGVGYCWGTSLHGELGNGTSGGTCWARRRWQ